MILKIIELCFYIKEVHIGFPLNYPFFFLKNDKLGRVTFFSGEAGVWRKVLSQEQSHKIDNMLEELDGSGLKLDQV